MGLRVVSNLVEIVIMQGRFFTYKAASTVECGLSSVTVGARLGPT